MARFYGRLQGHRKMVTKVGTPNSGLLAEAQGWDLGAAITMGVDDETGEDVVTVVLTGGSHASCQPRHLGSFRRVGSKIQKIKV